MTNFELTNAICEEIRAEYRTPCLSFFLEEGEPGLTGSKVGGTPYLPKGTRWPVDEQGVPLQFLAQIDCTQLIALPDYPHAGLLQFFIGTDEMFGCDFGAMKSKNYAVLYHETVDTSVTAADIPLPEPPEEDCSPLEKGPFRIVFGVPVDQGMTPGDFRFDPLFVQKWNQQKPDEPIEKGWDVFELLDEDDDEDDLFGCGGEDVPHHQLGGYPYFTQADPREIQHGDLDTLLFQLDSDTRGREFLICWGDLGVGNFFINREALKRRDFSRVLYNWDCG